MRTSSLRGKITIGYVLSFLFLAFVASVLFVNLLVVEDRIGSHAGISRFLDTTLEMRRYEKNYLLYGKGEDLEAAIAYAGTASALVRSGAMGGSPETSPVPGWLALLAGVERGAGRLEFDPGRTDRLLAEYAALLGRTGDAGSGAGAPDAAARAAAVRDLGRSITQIAERLSTVEARNVQEMLRSSRRVIVLLVVVFLLGTAIIARIVLLTAIRPLKELEVGMQRIAAGHFEPLPAGPEGGEIGSMNAAFNRMIHEVFEHRREMMRSERLASLGTMLAGIAHEINNPLSNISTSAELLREEEATAGSAQCRELLDQIISQTDRATDIIRTVLDFSREQRFEPRPTNLASAILGAVILVRGEMPAHVSVDIDVPPDIEITADKAKLQQAFVNLLTNAIDAMREAHREGNISISARPGDDASVDVAFRDRGTGIPPDVVDRIFDPFFSTKDVGHGTGLGLYLTHQIVEQHGGSIRVESAIGEGTTVTLRLPRRAVPEGPPGEARAEEGG
jgi:two-component system NtrC family sensor kinase